MQLTRITAVLVTLIAGVACGYLVGRGSAGRRPAPGAASQAGGEVGRAIEEGGEAWRLREELRSAAAREKELEARIAELETAAGGEQGDATAAAPQDAAVGGTFTAAQTPSIASIAAAEAAMRERIAQGDIEGLWLLGADLLEMGEEGYDKLIALAPVFEQLVKENRDLSALFGDEGIFIGQFLRAVSDHDEELLRLGLYLEGQAASEGMELSEPLKSFRRELDEIGAVLLGYYHGDDPEILKGYADFFRSRIPDGPIEMRGSNVRKALMGLAQLPTDEAFELIIDVARRASPDLAQVAIAALAWQRHPRAAEELRALSTGITDPKVAELIERALLLLER